MPLSSAQQRMWFLDQLSPPNGMYNNPIATRLIGELHVPKLERSLQEVINRHEALRTVFEQQDGVAMQVIVPELTVTCKRLNLCETPETEREHLLQHTLAEEAYRPFDLQRGPLFRACLVQLGQQEHVLLLVLHHIVSDAWSLGLLVQELAALYAADGNAEAAGLNMSDLQYADFSLWQRDWLGSDAFQEQMTFWQEHLGTELPALQLPIRKQHVLSAERHVGAEQRLQLSRSLTGALKELSQSAGTTLNMTMLAAFETLLSRYSGQQEFVIGTVIACRTRQELENMIGFFVNTLAMRVDVTGDVTFVQALERVRALWLSVYANQEVPFDKVVEVLHPDRVANDSPLFQVLFNFLNTEDRALQLPGLQSSEILLESATAKFELQLDVEEREKQLHLRFEYNRALYTDDAIRRMGQHLITLLESIVQAPEQRLWELELLPEAEKQLLLVEWNDNRMAVTRDKCIHQLFEDQVARTPDRCAVVYGEARMTYRELNERANQLAWHLRSLGVGPETLVGLCMERTFDLLVGVYGILKAGGAYVPLDPAYPKERIAMMMEDAQAPVIVTQAKLQVDMERLDSVVVCLDRDWDRIAAQPTDTVESGVQPTNLGYVIYTSGSTGRPKGVAVEHHNTVAMLEWGLSVMPRDSFSGVLASTSVCFDVSVFELFAALLCGGTLILADNALALPELPARAEVTQINTVPSAMAELLRVDGVPGSVQVLNLGGEPLPNALAQQAYGQLPTVSHVINLYGPSEDTTYSTFEIVKKGTDESMTVGRPIANTQAYILDEHLLPVPIGVVGHLYLAGAGLARGYLNKPEMTAERYIANPFADEPGARMYTTGDLARYLPDGRIEYLGRID
ncbi:MAG: non-ribosomal peptide synthetase, partial [Tumebacillaceae bacterium]